MKTTLIALSLLAAALSPRPAQSQTVSKDVQVCWTPAGGSQTCQTFTAGSVTLVTLDLRPSNAEYIVVQPLPAYQVTAMQTHVSNQTYNMAQADSSLKTVQRYSSIQDLLVQSMIRNMIQPILQLYPPTGADAGKTSTAAIGADILAGTRLTVIQ